jgi:hypothetical protein
VLNLDTETLLATLLLSLVTLPLVVSTMRTRSRRAGWSALGLWLLASAAAAWGGGLYDPSEPDRDAQPIEVSGDDYVTSRSCKACHPHEYDTWHSSFHRTMTQLEEWYGTPPPALDEDDRSIAASLLWALRGDAGMRVIVANAFGRASAREVSGSAWMTPAIAFLMTDPYHAVRYVAERSYQLQQESARLGLAYDFVAPPATRSRETLEIFDGWGVRAHPDRRTGDELLITEDGQLMIDVFNRLLSERDDRPVTLNERTART